jgi:hypothetical protein
MVRNYCEKESEINVGKYESTKMKGYMWTKE